MEDECDFRQRIGKLHKGEDHWWNIGPRPATRRTVDDVLAALDRGVLWLDGHADPHSLLADALRDPSRVNALNLASLVALAKKIGNERQVEAAEAELRRWQEGERPAPSPAAASRPSS